ncbi:MAG: cysteine--tRNA ligase [Candidatus Kaiserbacteria bacterium]|nr:cysteine--tRNA ligase [Candidatus Kaiserbacteria bacterium]
MMWPFSKKASPSHASSERPVYFYNTLSKEKQLFTLPPVANSVRMYNCGPTVYGRQHIGNLSMFVFADLLRKTLEYNNFQVKQVINITDVGHLVSDGDEGEDKMTKGLKQRKMKLTLENMRLLADEYTDIFKKDLETLNIDISKINFPRASDYISTQIAMVETLEQKGYAYRTLDGVYYDTTRFGNYGALGGIDLEGLKEGARVATVEGKRHPSDFALWKLDKKLGWPSPFGQGFPGWHIECSAMIRKTLGEQIDIHTGGIEHIPVHHNNEIAQSEAVTGKRPLSRFWMHRAHVQIESKKIAKSGGNVVYLSEIVEKGYQPQALRYLFLGAHYRTSSNFSWEALTGSATALSRLAAFASAEGGVIPGTYQTRFIERMNDDLDTPGALAVLWEMTKDESLSKEDIAAGIRDADKILGLGLADPETLKLFVKDTIKIADVPSDVALLIDEREEARSNKDFAKADELRSKIAEMGYDIKDGAAGVEVVKR